MVKAWTAASGSVRGSAHRRRGEPSEDAHGVVVAERGSAVAVADGHGSDRCPRADRGARLAVDSVLGLLTGGAQDDTLCTELVERWRAAVETDANEDPFPSEALIGEDLVRAYGTTLLAAMATDATLTLLQVGDGDIVVSLRHGAEVISPTSASSVSWPGHTESLSQPDAVRRFRTAYLSLAREEVDMVLLATDGFGGAYADPDWQPATARDVLELARAMAADELDRACARWCEAPAEVAGDDATLGLLIRTSLLRSSVDGGFR